MRRLALVVLVGCAHHAAAPRAAAPRDEDRHPLVETEPPPPYPTSSEVHDACVPSDGHISGQLVSRVDVPYGRGWLRVWGDSSVTVLTDRDGRFTATVKPAQGRVCVEVPRDGDRAADTLLVDGAHVPLRTEHVYDFDEDPNAQLVRPVGVPPISAPAGSSR